MFQSNHRTRIFSRKEILNFSQIDSGVLNYQIKTKRLIPLGEPRSRGYNWQQLLYCRLIYLLKKVIDGPEYNKRIPVCDKIDLIENKFLVIDLNNQLPAILDTTVKPEFLNKFIGKLVNHDLNAHILTEGKEARVNRVYVNLFLMRSKMIERVNNE